MCTIMFLQGAVTVHDYVLDGVPWNSKLSSDGVSGFGFWGLGVRVGGARVTLHCQLRSYCTHASPSHAWDPRHHQLFYRIRYFTSQTELCTSPSYVCRLRVSTLGESRVRCGIRGVTL